MSLIWTSVIVGNDSSVKDLTFAVLMSANDGSINVKANWDKVEHFMQVRVASIATQQPLDTCLSD